MPIEDVHWMITDPLFYALAIPAILITGISKSGFGGAMGGVVFGLIVGQMLTRGTGYGPVFAIAGSLHVIAFLLILATVRRVQPVQDTGEVLVVRPKTNP